VTRTPISGEKGRAVGLLENAGEANGKITKELKTADAIAKMNCVADGEGTDAEGW